jgi:hypothetical protein
MKERMVSMNDPLSSDECKWSHWVLKIATDGYYGDTREWKSELGGTYFLPSCEEFFTPLL